MILYDWILFNPSINSFTIYCIKYSLNQKKVLYLFQFKMNKVILSFLDLVLAENVVFNKLKHGSKLLIFSQTYYLSMVGLKIY